MKKVLFIIALFLGFNAVSQEKIGQIGEITVSKNGVIEVEVFSNASAYVGITLNEGGFPEKNFDAIHINGLSQVRIITLREYRNLATQSKYITSGVEGIVSIWSKKKTKIMCSELGTKEPCEYCKINGIHLEGKLATKTFRFKISSAF